MMTLLAILVVAWLGFGAVFPSLVLRDQLRSGLRIVEIDWFLVAGLAFGWPWVVWLWYSSRHRVPENIRLGLLVTMLMGSLCLGWLGGLYLYDYLYVRQLQPADAPGLNVMTQGP
jgi:hypothetical protein